jgi:hypothetical protein
MRQMLQVHMRARRDGAVSEAHRKAVPSARALSEAEIDHVAGAGRKPGAAAGSGA